MMLVLLGLLLSLCLHYHACQGHSFNWRDHLAGGLAGGIANAIIFPIDTIKTMLQTNPNIKSPQQALKLIHNAGLDKLYSGFVPAVLGSVPSSSLYFGTYELAKKALRNNYNITNRHIIHTLAASSGNVASSFVFVPKEVIKQQLQAFSTGTLKLPPNRQPSTLGISKYIFETYGLKGFYPSYAATLARNIPSAAV
jgi:hypothetical protein